MGLKRKLVVVSVMVGIVLLLASCGGGEKKNIAIGPAASETNSMSKHLLKAYGIGEGDHTIFEEGFGDAADGVQDGNIDISIGVLGLPAGSIESLQATSGDVKMLGLSDEAIKYMEENTEYERHTIPKDTYDFLDDDVETVTAYAILMANTDTIDEELGYELAKAMVEYADENTHAQGKEMTLENALNGSEGLPIHPGAARYYEEQGLTFDNPIAEIDATDSKSDLILGTGSQGGTYYPLGGEMANIWNNHVDGINVTNTETNASAENLAGIRDGNIDLGMTVHVTALYALNGEGDFEKEGSEVENVAFIGHIYPEVVQVITRENTGIESLDDLKK
ncbi:MAG TPA: TAXI family TRAP transporter solute-binding subunit [Bacillota bacterium]